MLINAHASGSFSKMVLLLHGLAAVHDLAVVHGIHNGPTGRSSEITQVGIPTGYQWEDTSFSLGRATGAFFDLSGRHTTVHWGVLSGNTHGGATGF